MPFTKENAAEMGKLGGRPKGLFAEKFRDYADDKGWAKLLKWCGSSKFNEAFPALKFVFEMGYGKPTEFNIAQFVEPLQKVINKTSMLEEMYALNYSERNRSKDELGSRDSTVQT